ncbi:hypothetical protein PQO03_01315 [Lentisphaera profundi]|uniref:Uncharacterized protein n=1 Tax=Lentisphaera profundi TaxID=1658616 RepID=A0ABY7VQY8_9BACT|nr:hypothetical protein [Lentisphaera profundi]WDE96606.1 hypothetical protein PQO03_01315 [Lentisphaera profundi]
MDGIVGLIIFAVISFVYNKITQNKNGEQGQATDLSEWLEEVEKTPEVKPPPPPKELKLKNKTLTTVPKTENIKKNINDENYSSQLTTFTHKIKESPDPYRTVHNYSSQTFQAEGLTKTRNKKRHSLNYKNRKTLRQAFILNTVLSKAKSYEP